MTTTKSFYELNRRDFLFSSPKDVGLSFDLGYVLDKKKDRVVIAYLKKHHLI